MMKSIFLTFSLAILTVGVAFGQDKKADQKEADRLIGVWAPSNGLALVKVQNIAGKYYGRIVKLKEPKGSRSNKLPRIGEVILCANKAKNLTIRTDGVPVNRDLTCLPLALARQAQLACKRTSLNR